MERELYKTERIISDELDNRELVVEYYLTSCRHPFKSGDINYVCYGVEIKMYKEGGEDFLEKQSAEEIFFSKKEALRFIDNLANGKVTPCTLNDLVEDALKESLMG